MKTLLLILVLSQAPTSARPQFEVASINVHPPPNTSWRGRCDRQRAETGREL